MSNVKSTLYQKKYMKTIPPGGNQSLSRAHKQKNIGMNFGLNIATCEHTNIGENIGVGLNIGTCEQGFRTLYGKSSKSEQLGGFLS